MDPSRNNLVILTVLDGWGIAPPGPGNAITLAKTPNINSVWASYPHTELGASGQSVGLPRGEDGNTETGHLNIGAGRIVYQDLARINMSIADGTFFTNRVLLEAIEHARNNNSRIHLMGLVGAGGVHSNVEHLYALISLLAKQKYSNVFVHVFTDGRDSPPTAAKSYINQLQNVLKKEGVGTIASVMGRYWSMDRDRRWDRTAKAYFALTRGEGVLVNSAQQAVELSYSKGATDEFIEPSLIVDSNKKPLALVHDNDSVIFFNFRIDRPRQLSRAFVLSDFQKYAQKWEFDPYSIKYEKTHQKKVTPAATPTFERGRKLENLYFVTMTEYEKILNDEGAHVAFPPEIIDMPLGRVVSLNNQIQLRAAESEKERFVTFYFNGLREEPFIGEERLIVPSPSVPTYDLKPEMSAYELTEAVLNRLKNSFYLFVLINYANPDMTGHTGNLAATIKGVEAADACLGKLIKFVTTYGGNLLITGDHGNAEELINPQTNAPDTEHSTNPVPFITVSNKYQSNPQSLSSGILADIAPTALKLMGLEVPTSMMGRDLLAEVKPTKLH
jgi:2,3-bisphosphoglycerate-independent phosphoglycerate mutase